jgi:hypothetical protein
MNQNFLRTITEENLKITLKLLNLEKSLKDEDKFNIFIRNWYIPLAQEIIEKKIKYWSQVKEVLLYETIKGDDILRVTLEKREANEYRTNYIDRIGEKLAELGCSENLIVKHLASKLWSGNEFRIINLLTGEQQLKLRLVFPK